MTPEIVHDSVRGRFETDVDGEHCALDYALDGDAMTITHVKVPDPVSHHGIAAALMQAALETARVRGWRVRPRCPYATHYLEKYPEWSDLIARS